MRNYFFPIKMAYDKYFSKEIKYSLGDVYQMSKWLIRNVSLSFQIISKEKEKVNETFEIYMLDEIKRK
jgi:hypothetical protein